MHRSQQAPPYEPATAQVRSAPGFASRAQSGSWIDKALASIWAPACCMCCQGPRERVDIPGSLPGPWERSSDVHDGRYDDHYDDRRTNHVRTLAESKRGFVSADQDARWASHVPRSARGSGDDVCRVDDDDDEMRRGEQNRSFHSGHRSSEHSLELAHHRHHHHHHSNKTGHHKAEWRERILAEHGQTWNFLSDRHIETKKEWAIGSRGGEWVADERGHVSFRDRRPQRENTNKVDDDDGGWMPETSFKAKAKDPRALQFTRVPASGSQ